MSGLLGAVQTITVFQSSRPVSTVSGDIVSIPTSFLSQPATDTRQLGSLLTGVCTVPYFADVTNAAGVVLRYPQIGCSPDLLDCCPFTFQDNISLIACPADHYSVARGSYTACCPSNFGLLYTGVGFQTPCYSNLSTYLVPEETPSPNVWLATDTLFARSYQLVPDPRHRAPAGLSSSALGGLVAGLVIAGYLLLAALVYWMLKRRRQRQAHTSTVSDKDAEGTGPISAESVGGVPLPQYSPKEVYAPPDALPSQQSAEPPLARAEMSALPDEHPLYRTDDYQQSLVDVAMAARNTVKPERTSMFAIGEPPTVDTDRGGLAPSVLSPARNHHRVMSELESPTDHESKLPYDR